MESGLEDVGASATNSSVVYFPSGLFSHPNTRAAALAARTEEARTDTSEPPTGTHTAELIPLTTGTNHVPLTNRFPRRPPLRRQIKPSHLYPMSLRQTNKVVSIRMPLSHVICSFISPLTNLDFRSHVD